MLSSVHGCTPLCYIIFNSGEKSEEYGTDTPSGFGGENEKGSPRSKVPIYFKAKAQLIIYIYIYILFRGARMIWSVLFYLELQD